MEKETAIGIVDYRCVICWDSITSEDFINAPCHCKGTMGHYHQQCFAMYFVHSRKCNVCNGTFKRIGYKPICQWRFLRWTFREIVMLITTSSSIIITACAIALVVLFYHEPYSLIAIIVFITFVTITAWLTIKFKTDWHFFWVKWKIVNSKWAKEDDNNNHTNIGQQTPNSTVES